MTITLHEIAETCERLLPEWEVAIGNDWVQVKRIGPHTENRALFRIPKGLDGCVINERALGSAESLRQHSEIVNRLLMINAIIVAHDPEVCRKLQPHFDAIERKGKS